MKRLRFLRSSLGALSIAAASLCLATSLHAAEASGFSSNNDKPVKIGVVNFKLAVEDSKAGKLEQTNFENLKKQMESVLEEKEKSLTEIAAKFNDPDYLDSLSAEAENELKHKFRTMNQDLTQIQNQYYQTLNQANMKVLQKLNDVVAEAATKVAKERGYDLIVNDDSIYFSRGSLDITNAVIENMNVQFDKEQRENKNTASPLK
ncbi:MAG: OmpH family outer membrane protein [Parachlamydiaceae bacterium]|nr:OmpH family outer membrane protein [Parachlamydiaceae bacterium]